MNAINESREPGSHAIFTHSLWRGLADSRAAALLLLAGRLAAPWPGALPDCPARSPGDMCAMCSSIGGE